MKPTKMKLTVGSIIMMLVIVMVFGGMAVARSKPKTNANIELARKIGEEVWSKGNMVVADQIFSNEIVRHSADLPDIRGKEAYKQFVLGTRAAFPDWKETVQNAIASGDLVATQETMAGTMTGSMQGPKGTLPPTGKRFETTSALFVRIAKGKIVEIWCYYDSAAILEAMGVLPPPPPK